MAAIKFLNSISLQGSQIQNFLVQPVGTAPTVYGVGQLYYDTSTNKLRLRDNTGWVNISTADADTKYDLTVEQNSGSNTNPKLTLTGTDSTVDAITLTGSGGVTVTRSSNTGFTIDGTNGDITAVQQSTSAILKGISVSSGTGPIPVVGLDIQGQTQLSGTPDTGDRLLIFDGSTPGNKYITVSDLMSAGQQGDITQVNITAGNGLSGTSVNTTAGAHVQTLTVGGGDGITITAGAVNVDYLGSDSVILAAADGTGIGSAATGDRILVSDTSDSGNNKYINISQLPTSGGTVTSVAVTDGYLIDSSVANPTAAANITLNVDASELVDMTQTMLTGDEFFVLDISETGKDQGKRKAAGEIGLSIFNNDAGFITSSSVVTYTLPVSSGGANSAVVTLDASSGTDSTLTIAGTTSEIAITESTGNNGTITIGLPDDVTIAGDLTVNGGDINLTAAATDIDIIDNNASALSFDASGKSGILEINSTNGAEAVNMSGVLKVAGTGQSSFAGQVTVPTTPSASTDAASKAFVISESSSVGTFQGGYNASTNAPALSGGSNTAMNKGDFYVVSTAGNAFFSTQLEPGDFIFADDDITASSSPAKADYTIVIADQNIAGAGSTDGNTQKGVAGFDSANFTVSSNGWVQVSNVILGTETTGNYTATVAESTSNNRLGVDVSGATGEGQAAVVGLDIIGRTQDTTPASGDSLLIYDTSASTNKRVTVENLAKQLPAVTSFAGDYPATSVSSWTVVHTLNTLDVLVQVFDKSTGANVYPDIVRTNTTTVTINCSAAQSVDSLRVLVTALA